MHNTYLLDTNVLVDMVVPNRPQHSEAVSMFRIGRAAEDDFIACVTSLKDAYYIIGKHYRNDDSDVRRLIARLMSCLTIVDLTFGDAMEALVSDEPDMEDGMIRAVAERCGCAAIVSRDAKAFVGSRVDRIEPKDFA